VSGADSFYVQPLFRSAFVVVDMLLLLAATGIDLFILLRYWSDLTVPSVIRLLGVAFGMWFMWWKAYTSHRQIRPLYSSRMIAKPENEAELAELGRIAATMTHNAMFVLCLLVVMLLINYDYVLNHHRY
jgi:hypothetical protein